MDRFHLDIRPDPGAALDDDPGHQPRSERHDDARAYRRRHVVGHAVGEEIEVGNGNGYMDEHGGNYCVSNFRTTFMSSQTSRFEAGFLSRYAGWNVGMSLAPR